MFSEGAAPPEQQAHTYEVEELGWELNDILNNSFPEDVWVRGQIRDLNKSSANHVYFKLVTPAAADEIPAASLNVVLFNGYRQIVNRILGRAAVGHMTNGVEVRILVKVNFWTRGGRLNLLMHSIDPHYTLEQLSADRDKLIADLLREGLMERNKLLALPEAPLRVGLITRAESAAYADFLDELGENFGWEVLVADTPTQGFGCESRIAAALGKLEAAAVDVIALVRGGGSSTDLMAFNSREVACAIARCGVPVLTGIGHETDKLVADLVAHKSLKTPTACARALVERAEQFRWHISGLWYEVRRTASENLEKQRQELNFTGTQLTKAGKSASNRAAGHLREQAAHLSRAAYSEIGKGGFRLNKQRFQMTERSRSSLEINKAGIRTRTQHIRTSSPRAIQSAQQRHKYLTLRAAGHDPKKMMARGWAILSGADGELLRSVTQVALRSKIRAQLLDGQLSAEISQVSPIHPGD